MAKQKTKVVEVFRERSLSDGQQVVMGVGVMALLAFGVFIVFQVGSFICDISQTNIYVKQLYESDFRRSSHGYSNPSFDGKPCVLTSDKVWTCGN